MLHKVKVSITHGRWRLEGVVDPTVAPTKSGVQDTEIVQVLVPCLTTLVVNSGVNDGFKSCSHCHTHLLHINGETGWRCAPHFEQLVVVELLPDVIIFVFVQLDKLLEVSISLLEDFLREDVLDGRARRFDVRFDGGVD